jgi:hypothetical protein
MKNYNYIQKFLHDLVLKNKFINISLYELEKLIYHKNFSIKNEKHIFITGLPRSGTTSILNFLYSSNEFSSLTYKNMPFVFSPNFSNIFNKKNFLKKERLHADGLTYDINSPEALDEIFFCNNEEFVKNELELYLQLILLSDGKEKYLSKNNLNYKRVNLINSILPNSFFLIPIRDPLQHANSLLSQHLRFCKLQKEDNFILRYMNYLHHNEFGLNHRSWNSPVKFSDFNDLNYWLEQWCFFYQNIYRNYKFNDNCIFLIYENLMKEKYQKAILNRISLNNVDILNYNNFKNSNKKYFNINPSDDISKNAYKIYKKFKDNSVLNLGS